MMNHELYYTEKDATVRVVKNYMLRVKKLDGQISVSRESNELNYLGNGKTDGVSLFSEGMTAEDVNVQLANVRHIGFEVTDACNSF